MNTASMTATAATRLNRDRRPWLQLTVTAPDFLEASGSGQGEPANTAKSDATAVVYRQGSMWITHEPERRRAGDEPRTSVPATDDPAA